MCPCLMKLNQEFVIISFITEHSISTKLQLKINGFGITAGDYFENSSSLHFFTRCTLQTWFTCTETVIFFCTFIWKESFLYSSPFPDPAEKPAEVFAQTISSACHYWCKSQALGPGASCKPAPWSTLRMAYPAHCRRFYPKMTDKSCASNLLFS